MCHVLDFALDSLGMVGDGGWLGMVGGWLEPVPLWARADDRPPWRVLAPLAPLFR